MLETKIDLLTKAIIELTATIASANITSPSISDEHPALKKAAKAIDEIHAQEAAEKLKAEVDLEADKPKEKTTRKTKPKDVTKNKNVTEVELDDAPWEAEELTRDGLQSLFIATVKRDRDLKPKIKEILKDHGANTLPELDSSKFNDVAKAVRGL